MSRLIEIDPDVEQVPEEDGHEFGYYTFDILPPIEVYEIDDKSNDKDHVDVSNLPKNILL